MARKIKKKYSWGRQRRLDSRAQAKERATNAQWQLIDMAIKAFISKYPIQWIEFQNQIKTIRDGQEDRKWRLWGKDDLKKAHWRMSATFPVIEDRAGVEIDSLMPVLEKIIPKLFEKGSINYEEFLRRHPQFLPSEKL